MFVLQCVETFRSVDCPQGPPGIALGGGAARGLSHIGVLEKLNEGGLVFPLVAGTSTGALVAAAYASGKLDNLKRFALSIKPKTLFGWLGLLKGKSVLEERMVWDLVCDLFGGLTFEGVRRNGISLTLLACDLETGKPVFLCEGSLPDAVMASITFPGVLPPYRYGNRTLADGGITGNVPVNALKRGKAGLTVGVDVHNPKDIWIRTLNACLFATGQLGKNPKHEGRCPARWGLMNSVVRALDLIGWTLGSNNDLSALPDVLIRPPVGRFHAHQFYLAEALIKAGHVAGTEASWALRALMKNPDATPA